MTMRPLTAYAQLFVGEEPASERVRCTLTLNGPTEPLYITVTRSGYITVKFFTEEGRLAWQQVQPTPAAAGQIYLFHNNHENHQ